MLYLLLWYDDDRPCRRRATSEPLLVHPHLYRPERPIVNNCGTILSPTPSQKHSIICVCSLEQKERKRVCICVFMPGRERGFAPMTANLESSLRHFSCSILVKGSKRDPYHTISYHTIARGCSAYLGILILISTKTQIAPKLPYNSVQSLTNSLPHPLTHLTRVTR